MNFWLDWFVDHAGIAERIIEPKAPSTDYTPDAYDDLGYGGEMLLITLRWQWPRHEL